jgi:hypothetical protein
MSDLVSVLALIVGVSAIITDELLTKIGLKLGCGERNPVFNILRKRMGEKYVHALLTVAGSLILVSLFLLFDYGALLLLFAVALMTPVIINASTILRVLELKHTHNPCIE